MLRQQLVIVDVHPGGFERLAGFFQRGSGQANGHGGDQRAGVVEGLHDPGKALFDIDRGVAEQVVCRHPAILEHERSGVGGLDAQLLFQPDEFEARRALFHDKGFDRGPAGGFVQRGPDHDQIGALAGRDVDLLAVEDVLVAISHSGGAYRRRIRAAARFGNGHGGPATGEALQLLFVGHRGDGRVAQTLTRHGQQQADIAPAHFDNAQCRGQIAAVAIAVVVGLLPANARRPGALTATVVHAVDQ